MDTYSAASVTERAPEAVLQAALSTLLSLGFTIVKRDASSATVTGPGLNSTRQHPMLGASAIELKVVDEALQLRAELGGVQRMERFLKLFPLLLGLSLGLFFGVIGGFAFGQAFGVGFGVPWAPGWRWLVVALAFSVLPVAPWLVLGPLMSHAIRQRTQRALTALIGNADKLAAGTQGLARR